MNKYVSGGKIWLPRKQPKTVSQEKSFWASIAITGNAMVLLPIVFAILVVIGFNMGINFGATVPKGTSDLEVKFNSSLLLFFVYAIAAIVIAVACGVYSMFSVNPLVSKSRKVRLFKRVSRLLFVPILTVALVWGTSTYLPHDDSPLKHGTATYVKLWAAGEGVVMSRTQATELANFVWGKKPNADKNAPKDSKPYVFPVDVDGKTKNIFVYKIEKNDILFSLKK
jgi:hypothetical protein